MGSGSMRVMSVKRVGDLLVEHDLITQEQLNEALDLHKLFPTQQVGQLLCKLGHIHESDLSSFLDQSDKRRKLGDVMLAMGLIDQEKLDNASDLSKRDGISIGKAVLQLKYVDEENLAKAIASQHDMPYVQINSPVLPLELASYISKVYAQKQRIIPISKIGNALTLAMVNPLKVHDLRELEDSIRLKIISVITTETCVDQALKRLYNIEVTGRYDSDENTILDLKEDEASFRRALEIDPDSARAHFELGLTLKNEAEASFRRALEIGLDWKRSLRARWHLVL